MLKFKIIDKNQFDNFTSNLNIASHYMQSQSWGEFSKVYYGLIPHYLGLFNEKNEIVVASLLLEKKYKSNYSSFYIPYGFIADFNKNEIIKEFTNHIINYTKQQKGLFIRIKPNVIEKRTNYLNEEIINDKYISIIDNLKALGYKKIKEDDINTYIIDLEQTEEEILDHITDNAKETINQLRFVNIDISTGNKNDLKSLNKDKNNKKFNEILYEIFKGNKATKAEVTLTKLNTIKTINEHEKELKKINNQISIIPIDHLTKSSKDKLNSLTKTKKELLENIDKYKALKKEYGNEIIISTALHIIHNNKTYLTSINYNKNINEELYYLAYLENIKYYKSKKLKDYIQHENDNKIKNLFGGNKIEYIGEFEYTIKPITYFVLKKLLKRI